MRLEAPVARDEGYALLAAVMAMAAFAYLAFQVLAASQGGVALASGRAEQARLAAAADAGIALAIHGLAANDRAVRWPIDGRPRQLAFDGLDITVTVEDERGKAPLAGLNDGQARALFAGAGAEGARLDALVAEFRDWQTPRDPGASARPSGSPAGPERAVRHGPFRTVGELGALADMDVSIFSRVAPVVTVFFEETGPFEPAHAQPLARATMSADTTLGPGSSPGGPNPGGLDAQPEPTLQIPDEDLGPDDHLIGRTLTVTAVARARDGARTHRMEIIELTGDRTNPFWVRYTE